jgi:hypothetical protein
VFDRMIAKRIPLTMFFDTKAVTHSYWGTGNSSAFLTSA